MKELYAKDPDSTRKEAAGLESVTLTSEDLEWVHVLAEGWASPLDGPLPSVCYLALSTSSEVSFVIIVRFLW